MAWFHLFGRAQLERDLISMSRDDPDGFLRFVVHTFMFALFAGFIVWLWGEAKGIPILQFPVPAPLILIMPGAFTGAGAAEFARLIEPDILRRLVLAYRRNPKRLETRQP